MTLSNKISLSILLISSLPVYDALSAKPLVDSNNGSVAPQSDNSAPYQPEQKDEESIEALTSNSNTSLSMPSAPRLRPRETSNSNFDNVEDFQLPPSNTAERTSPLPIGR